MPLANWISGLRRISRSRPSFHELEAAGRELAGVSTSTEGVFLEVGQRLVRLHGQAQEIVHHTTSIAEVFSSGDGSLASLDEVLSHACTGAVNHELDAVIAMIQDSTRTIQTAVDATGNVVKSFEVLGVMTRIESARFAGAGTTFIGLADSVAALTGQIREQIGAAKTSATALLETVSAAAREMRQAARKREQNLAPLTLKITEELQQIHTHRTQAAAQAKVLGRRFEETSKAIGDVVLALQGHDIVRQQIEHVLEALEQKPAADVSNVARLQAAQLDNSRRTFEASVSQVRESLVEIGRNTQEMAEESARILGLSGSDERSFLSTIESGLGSILAILESDQEADRRMATAAESVTGRLQEIEQTINGVQGVGGQMRRIALNATIEAAHLGEAGGALEIVAQAIQTLARDCVTLTDTMSEKLSAMRGGVNELVRLAGATAEETGSIALLRQSTANLNLTENRAAESHTQAVALSEDLAREIQDTTVLFGTQQDSLEVLARASRALQEIAAREPASAQNDRAFAEVPVYTMESERAVHRALFEAPGATLETAPPEAPEDNVEFF